MRIAVVGTGGVGGYFGAKLALAGHDVIFVARGAHLDAIRRGGLRIESAATPMHVRDAKATDDLATIGRVDVAMVCVKLWDVERTAPLLAPLVAEGGLAIPFQNGIDAPGMLMRALGAARVAGGVAHIAASIAAPGVVRHVGTMARLTAGAFEDAQRAAVTAFVDAARASGIDVSLAGDIRRALWEKFVFLSALSGATCITRQPIGVIRADPDMRAMLEAIMRETWSVGRAQGVAFADDFIARQLAFADALPHEMVASMLHDLVAGRRIEAPWLCGAVVRLGRELGVATPVNHTILAALKSYVDGVPR